MNQRGSAGKSRGRGKAVRCKYDSFKDSQRHRRRARSNFEGRGGRGDRGNTSRRYISSINESSHAAAFIPLSISNWSVGTHGSSNFFKSTLSFW
ncbi:hypothetical protein P9112_005605 [Eukaryota sp. TZLM1-RC]